MNRRQFLRGCAAAGAAVALVAAVPAVLARKAKAAISDFWIKPGDWMRYEGSDGSFHQARVKSVTESTITLEGNVQFPDKNGTVTIIK